MHSEVTVKEEEVLLLMSKWCAWYHMAGVLFGKSISLQPYLRLVFHLGGDFMRQQKFPTNNAVRKKTSQEEDYRPRGNKLSKHWIRMTRISLLLNNYSMSPALFFSTSWKSSTASITPSSKLFLQEIGSLGVRCCQESKVLHWHQRPIVSRPKTNQW